MEQEKQMRLKVESWFPVLAVALSAGVPAVFAQSPLTSGTVVTGQCQGHESEPGCVLPNLFGPQGLTLTNNGAFPHYAHFIGSAQQTLNQTLSSAIATQLAILPLISPASGFTFSYDKAAGVFVRSTTSFGSVYTERSETIGKGKFSFGTSYQRFRFSSLDGIDLHNMPAVFSHIPGTGTGGADEPYEADVIQTSNNLSLNMDQTVLFGTVGLTNHLDISLAVPIASVRFSASADANIVRVSGAAFTLAPSGQVFPNPHSFPNGGLTNTYASTPPGSATGVGDITVRVKQSVYRGKMFQVAAALDLRLPSGDARKFLGSGATGVKPFIIISSNRRFSPHVNFGYQWNGDSILAGNITGTTVSELNDVAVIQNGPATKGSLPGQLSYSLGADWGATKKLTLSFDYLGQTLFNAPRVFLSTIQTADFSKVCNTLNGTTSCGLAPQTLPTITGGKDTTALNNGAVGAKYNLFGRFLITGDLLFRLDNKGLRQDVTPLIALSYAFGK
jgi:hypothetical protein